MVDAPKTVALTPGLHDYLVAHGAPPDDVQRELIAETATLGAVSAMQIAPEQGAFLTLLAKMLDTRLAVEVGTFTGYSAICLARGLAPGGRLVACDISDEWTSIARRYWERAGVADRIDLRLAPALETLRSLPRESPVDLAFIDADKGGYHAYYEELLARLRPGGLIVVDNVLWGGAVADGDDHHPDTVAIRAFNEHVAADDRVDRVMLPIADGLTLARKRSRQNAS